MKLCNVKFVIFFSLFLSFIPAKAQYRLLIHDKLHNSYSESHKGDRYTIVTSDSLMRTGTISGYNNTSISLLVSDSIQVIQLANIINLGMGAKANRGARLAARFVGYIVTSLGGIFALSTMGALSDGENQAAAVVGIAGAAGVAGGILMIRSSYRNTGYNRDFLTQPRYNFRVVPSTF